MAVLTDGPGEEGEILIRGPQVMAGSHDDPEATDAAFTDDGYPGTGDRGSRDGDNYYYVHGREKEMILTAGYNVYPAAVEEVLYDHPSVGEAAVFALPHERRGETVAAAVTPASGDEPDPDELGEYVLAELAPYKHPWTVLVLPELPLPDPGRSRSAACGSWSSGRTRGETTGPDPMLGRRDRRPNGADRVRSERDRRGVQKSVRYAMPPNPTTMRSAPGTW